METLVPTSWFVSVDFPALGAPMMLTKPQRVSAIRFSDVTSLVIVML
jgi:hypothetical protein